mgnify:CR=1 FL=1
MTRKWMIVDLETIAIDGVDSFIEEQSAPSNWKDPEKIAAYVADAKRAAAQKAALDIDLARIVCLGYWLSEEPEPTIATCKTEDDEKAALAQLLPYFKDFERTLIGFNSARYDWPLLMRRASYLGLPVPHINVDKYRTPNVDLWQKLSFNGAISAHGLRWYARRLKWDDLLDADPLKDGGGDVAEAIAANRWDDVAWHCDTDVRLTHRLAQWQQVIG